MIGLKEFISIIFLFSAIWDLSFRKVPNFFSFIFLFIALYLQIFLSCSYLSFIYGFVIFFAGLILWKHGFVGAADVKLIASFSLLLPPHRVSDFLVYMCLSGGVLAFFYVILARFLHAPKPSNRTTSFPIRIYRIAKWRLVRKAPFPYAVAIAVSGIITLWT